MGDAHMVGNDIDDQPHGALLQALSKRSKFFFRTDFGIEARVVGDVVAVQAAGMCHQKRRGVAVCNSQIVQVVHYRGRLAKSKCQVQLKPIGRTRDIRRFSWSSVLQCRASVVLRCWIGWRVVWPDAVGLVARLAPLADNLS